MNARIFCMYILFLFPLLLTHYIQYILLLFSIHLINNYVLLIYFINSGHTHSDVCTYNVNHCVLIKYCLVGCYHNTWSFSPRGFQLCINYGSQVFPLKSDMSLECHFSRYTVILSPPPPPFQ